MHHLQADYKYSNVPNFRGMISRTDECCGVLQDEYDKKEEPSEAGWVSVKGNYLGEVR